MFTHVSNASKVAFVTLVTYLKSMAFDLIDCQIPTGHLIRFGARKIPRTQFLELLQKSLTAPTRRGPWGLTKLIPKG